MAKKTMLVSCDVIGIICLTDQDQKTRRNQKDQCQTRIGLIIIKEVWGFIVTYLAIQLEQRVSSAKHMQFLELQPL